MSWIKYAAILACVWGAWSWHGTRPLSNVAPGVVAPADPVQTVTSAAAFQHEGFTITPKARIDLRARVLARKDYRLGAEAELSPTDLVFGWGDMSDPRIYQQLNISQSNRFYFWRFTDSPPIAPAQIIRSSANMHLIPANDTVKAALKKVRPGQLVQLSGHLINASKPSGWQWSSSLTREDSGAGACEVIWVEQLEIVALS
ncbi:MAG: hypothetical protein HEQ39_03110 [Rhizobacter sp.]